MAVTSALDLRFARSVIIPAALMFGAVLWWAGRDSQVAPSHAAPAATRENSSVSHSEHASDASSVAGESGPDSQKFSDTGFRDYVAGKYRFLQSNPALGAALLERERIAVAINTARQSSDPAAKEAMSRQQAALEALDRKVGALLAPSDLAAFEVLKDSDVEQFQLEDFAGGVSGVAPLSEADKKAILYTKLAYRQRFRQVLADSRFMRDDPGAAERKLAFAEVSRALAASRDSYLQEVRQYLYDDEQFALLRNYETTEFNAELEKLRRMAYGE